jgi:hypothetical protein
VRYRGKRLQLRLEMGCDFDEESCGMNDLGGGRRRDRGGYCEVSTETIYLT